jgi:DNA-binding PadR family transcriptional regulator
MMEMAALTPLEMHLLLALAVEPAHGYALVRRIEEDSSGRVRPLPGNLYSVIQRLASKGLLRESKRVQKLDEDRRRRYYELTPSGRRLLRKEAEHLEELTGRLRARLARSV